MRRPRVPDGPTCYFTRTALLRLIVLLSLCGLMFAEDKAGQVNQKLRRELSGMLRDDQKYRGAVAAIEKDETLSAAEKQKRVSAVWDKQDRLDKRNLKKLAGIIDKYGWPTRSAVGREGSFAAFLVVQHGDLEYQKKYLPLLKEAARRSEAAPSDAAMLEDRILMREGRKQIYGTQLRFNEATNKFELWPIEDEAGVDARRASVGLGPLAEYLKQYGLEYKPPEKQ